MIQPGDLCFQAVPASVKGSKRALKPDATAANLVAAQRPHCIDTGAVIGWAPEPLQISPAVSRR